ncbi:tetratricopeptide repeat-containing sulfotransferase family protein [Sphingomonas sp.]|uniref:tetratricopeptide repeat-containing sulfotransferase family protein n=1 Tax=Sphingomonas sp. TaxID=28214 RepID=UPI002FC9282E
MTDARDDAAEDVVAALAHASGLLGDDPAAALEQAQEILGKDPHHGHALRLVARALRRLGRDAEAEQAEMDAIRASAHNPILVQTARAITEGRWRDAEHQLRPYLGSVPDDAAAINMLGQIALHVAAHDEAERLFRQAIALAPRFTAARLKLADTLMQQNRRGEAIAALDELLAYEPGHFRAQSTRAASLAAIGDYDKAASSYRGLLDVHPDRGALWMSYGHVLKTVGRLAESISAYRRAIALDPGLGEAWWSLANLKTVELGETDRAAMLAALETAGDDPDRRLHLHFALGKAYEDDGRFAESFAHYSTANGIRRSMLGYDADKLSDQVDRLIALSSPHFFDTRRPDEQTAADPIFVLGMPRAGSTLVEQILSSHSMVEGTSELPYIPVLAREFISELWRSPDISYPELLAELDASALRRLREEYLRRAGLHRKTDRPFFVDKLPNNWIDIAFIQLILPDAKIIDARRHPLACCFSNFKQHFARGQAFAYSLEDMGHYYRDYVRLLRHYDEVLPGRVYRVIHEDLVAQPDAQIRKLLAHLELPFEEACLRFHENTRAVRTPSAEQVRRPIDPSGLDHWKAYEAWLDPLKAVLGPIADLYPDVPEELPQTI